MNSTLMARPRKEKGVLSPTGTWATKRNKKEPPGRINITPNRSTKTLEGEKYEERSASRLAPGKGNVTTKGVVKQKDWSISGNKGGTSKSHDFPKKKEGKPKKGAEE